MRTPGAERTEPPCSGAVGSASCLLRGGRRELLCPANDSGFPHVLKNPERKMSSEKRSRHSRMWPHYQTIPSSARLILWIKKEKKKVKLEDLGVFP